MGTGLALAGAVAAMIVIPKLVAVVNRRWFSDVADPLDRDYPEDRDLPPYSGGASW